MQKVKDVLESMPATVNSYVAWLLSDKLELTDDEMRKYNFLVMDLIKIPFRYQHPMDENRYKDGMNLRSDFQYETGKYLDGGSGIIPGCTFLEMLVALAYRCESQLMRNVDLGNRTKEWFFKILENLGFLDFTSFNWKYEYSDIIKDKVEFVMDRQFSPSGEGGMFPLRGKNCKNQRNEEIWNQLMAYLSENYVEKEEKGLELYL